MSVSLGLGLFDQVGQAAQFLGGDLCGAAGVAEVGGDGVLEGAAEEDVEDAAEGGASGLAAGFGGAVDELAALFAVGEVALGFEDAEEGAEGAAHGGVGDAAFD